MFETSIASLADERPPMLGLRRLGYSALLHTVKGSLHREIA
jgi:hypothetical protein